MKPFLFVHFTDGKEESEQIYFSLSKDGRHFHDLNKGNPVLLNNLGEKGARDPFIIYDEKNNKYFIIATDLKMANGYTWEKAINEGSRGIIVWESSDLLTWSEGRRIEIAPETAGNLWAPEAIYDEKKEAFLVFFASQVSGKHRIYYSYTEDFRNFTKAQLWIEKEQDIIDTTMIKVGNEYYRFSKDETTSRIIMEKSQELLGEYEVISSKILENLSGVEGPEIYQVGGLWFLILDRFKSHEGYMILSTPDIGKVDFTVMPEKDYDFGQLKKRHGGMIAITEKEYKLLEEKFGN